MEKRGKIITYEYLHLRYQELSHVNFRKCHKEDTKEGYERAQARERLLIRAFFADCKRYLNGDLKPKTE